MKVTVNGEPLEVPEALTIAELVGRAAPELAGRNGRGVAVAVDAEVVPRGEWPAHELTEGARVEVLRAIQGG